MSIYSQYKAKKKRAVDPNLPPRPTLLGHEKEFKTFREMLVHLNNQNIDHREEIAALKRKIIALESTLAVLRYHVMKK